MLPVLGKLALAFLGVEAADAFVVRRWWRRRSYAAALRKAAELGKPLLVVGRPQAGFINKVAGPDYGCGDVCTDIVGCSPCPREMRGPLEQILPQLAPASHVIYVSCTLYAALHLGSETVVGKIVLFGGLAYAGHRWWIA